MHVLSGYYYRARIWNCIQASSTSAKLKIKDKADFHPFSKLEGSEFSLNTHSTSWIFPSSSIIYCIRAPVTLINLFKTLNSGVFTGQFVWIIEKSRFPNAVVELNDLDRPHREELSHFDHLQGLDCIRVSSINPQICAWSTNLLQEGVNPRSIIVLGGIFWDLLVGISGLVDTISQINVPSFVWDSLISAFEAVPSDVGLSIKAYFSSTGVATALRFSRPKRARISSS